MIIPLILANIVTFFFRSNGFINLIFIFLSLFNAFFLLYYLALYIYIHARKKSIQADLMLPKDIINSDLALSLKISPIFIFTLISIKIKTDKCEIIFIYDSKNHKFKARPFYRGNHTILSYYIYFYDPVYYLKLKINIPQKNIINYFKSDSESVNTGILPLTREDYRLYKAFDDSSLIRDYLFGDDIRKILWRVLALVDEIKVRSDWFENSSHNFIPFQVVGIYHKDYFFSNFIIYKIYNLVHALFLKGLNVSVNGIVFSNNEDKKLQDHLFKIYEDEKSKIIDFTPLKDSILLISALSINLNPDKELWIPKNSKIYYLTMKDFFNVDSQKYIVHSYDLCRAFNLLFKYPSISKVANTYLKELYEYDVLFEKRYQIV
jgi:hypothetical protein